jgi:hypothetical protein
LLSDLKNIRVVCKCGASSELNGKKVHAGKDMRCECCQGVLIGADATINYVQLADVISDLQAIKVPQIEFVFPDEA